MRSKAAGEVNSSVAIGAQEVERMCPLTGLDPSRSEHISELVTCDRRLGEKPEDIRLI